MGRVLRLGLAMAVAIGAALALSVLWLRSRSDVVGTVASDALEAALAPAELPLTAADTDVILAIGCTFRANRLGLYGGKGTSPFLDRLGAAGVVFERNYAQAPWTRPSTGAILTGRWPRALRLDNPGRAGALSLALAPEHETLAEALGAAGYRTAGAVANPNAMRQFGFAQGFDSYLEPEATFKQDVVMPPGELLVDRVLAELDATPPDRRFYGQLLFTTTHEPRDPPPTLRALFLHLPPVLADYDAALRELDGQLARLYEGAKARRKNLLFIVVGDHGEGLRTPRGHGKGHGRHLFPTTIQVPLVYQHPALPRGLRPGGLSMNIDLAPTVRALLGLPPGERVDGVSQAEVVRGRAADAGHPSAFSETFFLTTKKSTIIEDGWQLVHDLKEQTWRLYRIDAVGAPQDLAAAEPERTRQMMSRLVAWEVARTADAAGAADLVAEPDAATTELLRAMGYVDGPDDE